MYANIEDERIKKGARTKLQNGEQSARTASGSPPSTAMCRSTSMWRTCPRRTSTRPRCTDLLTRLEFKHFIKRFDLSGESVSAPRLPELNTERVENVLEAFT